MKKLQVVRKFHDIIWDSKDDLKNPKNSDDESKQVSTTYEMK